MHGVSVCLETYWKLDGGSAGTAISVGIAAHIMLLLLADTYTRFETHRVSSQHIFPFLESTPSIIREGLPEWMNIFQNV
jgi:hypothetical protein